MKVKCDHATYECPPKCEHIEAHEPIYCSSLKCDCNEEPEFCAVVVKDVVCISVVEGKP